MPAKALARSSRASAQPKQKIQNKFMGKLQPRSFERIRSGEQIQYPTYTNVAAAAAAGVTAAKFPRRILYLSAGGTGSVPCLAFSDGTNWRQIALGVSAI